MLNDWCQVWFFEGNRGHVRGLLKMERPFLTSGGVNTIVVVEAVSGVGALLGF